MALSRASENIFEFKSTPSATIDSDVKGSIIAYYGDLKPESLYIQDVTEVVNQAKLFLDECMRFPMAEKPAMVLDIDDTRGDQPSDLEGGYAEHALKLPNYLYPKLAESAGVSIASLSMFKPKEIPPKVEKTYDVFNQQLSMLSLS